MVMVIVIKTYRRFFKKISSEINFYNKKLFTSTSRKADLNRYGIIHKEFNKRNIGNDPCFIFIEDIKLSSYNWDIIPDGSIIILNKTFRISHTFNIWAKNNDSLVYYNVREDIYQSGETEYTLYDILIKLKRNIKLGNILNKIR